MHDKSFLRRLGWCAAISLTLNAFIGQYIKSTFSNGQFTLTVDATYRAEDTMQFMYDTGDDFKIGQQVSRTWLKGRDTVQFPFQVNNGQQLRSVRLDFGTNPDVERVTLHSVSLSSGKRTLFTLGQKDISPRIGLLTGISAVETTSASFTLDTDRKPYDPYIVFDPVNELFFPIWQRTLALVVPWVLLLFLPFSNWMRCIIGEKSYVLLFVALFCAAIPLKIAWITFTSILLLAYALINGYKKRSIRFDAIHAAMPIFFMVPLLFLGRGNVSNLNIPLGFLLFAIIGALVDFSKRTDSIKKIYTTVFLTISSIVPVAWLLLMWYYGYYYKIDLFGYMADIKGHAYATTFWLYYPHTTFLSFFIIIGGIFCIDLYKKDKIGRSYLTLYGILAFCSLLLLGSRFAILMGLALPFLTVVSAKTLGKLLVPIWVVVFTIMFLYIDELDVQRNQLWQISWEAFTETPWLGHGTGTSETILNDTVRVRQAGFKSPLNMNHPHNQLLTYLLENGLLGTLMFLGAFFYIVYCFAKRGNKSMLLTCFMVLMLMIIESPFRTTTSLYVIAFLLSVFAVAESQLMGKSINGKVR